MLMARNRDLFFAQNLEISICGTPNPETGMIMNLGELDATIHRLILAEVDHRYLDEDVAFLHGQLSTVENVSQAMFYRLKPAIADPAKLYRVRLYESDINWTEVLNEDPHHE